ncbi:DUF927 domain-containing protein [Heliobacterium chlorum]|uniref:DUF927 domain-containing protein n=1 Tax=Heliobacterium chlorum TaxID=2698 RepID=A0ABR7T0R9_HELCL|nr:DUF927 domain-containing protein [Heliobacterium chlorum]MBC9783520.1 DUF927 domain-containing protein [Heliobacterium chlorum]
MSDDLWSEYQNMNPEDRPTIDDCDSPRPVRLAPEQEIELFLESLRNIPDGEKGPFFKDRVLPVFLKLNDFDRARTEKRLSKLMGVGVKELRAQVKAVEKPAEGEKTVQSVPVRRTSLLPKCPIDLHIPEGWALYEHGLYAIDAHGNATQILPVPIVLTKRLKPASPSEVAKIELAWLMDGRWRHITRPMTVVFQAKNIVSLADCELPVTSENAKRLVRFLHQLMADNLSDLPVVTSVSRYGWTGDDFVEFLPGESQEDVFIDLDEHEKLTERGSLEQWVKAFLPMFNCTDIAWFVGMVGFSGPLLSVLSTRSFAVHIWAGSGSGKTAAGYVMSSVWGNPDKTKLNFSMGKTGTALEARAALYQHVPILMNERETADSSGNWRGSEDSFQGLVYRFAEEQGRGRGRVDGSSRENRSWKTVLVTTGEGPLSSDRTKGGAVNRVLEINAQPLPDDSLAKSVYALAPRFHGTAGPAFVRRLVELIAENGITGVQDAYKKIYNHVASAKGAKSHTKASVEMVAVVCFAGALAGMWIFGMGEEAAFNRAIDAAESIFQAIPTKADRDEVTRCADYLWGCVSQYANRFAVVTKQGDLYGGPEASVPHVGDRAGFIEDGAVFLIPKVFNEWLKDGGYHQGTVREMACRGLIASVQEKEGDGMRTRYQVLKSPPWPTARRSESRFVCLLPAKSGDEGESPSKSGDLGQSVSENPSDNDEVPVF